jgi:hypothetical protein
MSSQRGSKTLPKTWKSPKFDHTDNLGHLEALKGLLKQPLVYMMYLSVR